MNNQYKTSFQSKFNIGQNIAEGIYQDITIAFNHLERGAFDKAFAKFKTIKGKIPITKISKAPKEQFKFLDNAYSKAHKEKNLNLLYRIIIKYSEVLIAQLDKNGMYLPSLKDMTGFV